MLVKQRTEQLAFAQWDTQAAQGILGGQANREARLELCMRCIQHQQDQPLEAEFGTQVFEQLLQDGIAAA